MKIVIVGLVIGMGLLGLEWVALDSFVDSLSGEMASSSEVVQVMGENPSEGFVSGYRLSTQHLQPAYNTVQRTQDVQ